MKPFMDKDFLLSGDTARTLFFEAAQGMPIFDWHCHLSPKEIYENKQPEDIAQLWLSGDHYKWRAMRSFGIEETYITGSASGYEKFLAWAKVMPYLIGNPLYHWAHLELQRFFGIDDILGPETADVVWNKANAIIAGGGFKPRELIERSNVACVCTTDDAADSLEYHRLIAEDASFRCRIIPAFRPDKALAIDQKGFLPWLASLEAVSGTVIGSFALLKEVLADRIAFFARMGCRASDHAFSYIPFEPAGEDELENIFRSMREGGVPDKLMTDRYKTALMRFFAAQYARLCWGMELHFGVIRNNNTAMFQKIGPDTGFDSIADFETAVNLAKLLDSMEIDGNLPKTVLFTLNPKDNYMLGAMAGNFQSSGAAGKIQFGTAWWFNDNIDGMREQMKALANTGVLGKFIGMVTDSRSFLSYPRHEYFRRILCDLIGSMVDGGLYPCDMEFLKQVVRDICYNNAAAYFGI